MRVSALMKFIEERERIRQKKELGRPKPWTKDSILQSYRFCNAYREHDKETVWIRDNWRYPNRNDQYVWFAMCVARLINWSPTLCLIGYPVAFLPLRMIKTVVELQEQGEKVFTGAYMIRAEPAKPGENKIHYLVNQVLMPLWLNRNNLTKAIKGATLAEAHGVLREQYAFGSFIAGQVIADVKYTSLLIEASDWWTWAAIGPGSSRGLNRVMGLPTEERWDEALWLGQLQELQACIQPLLKKKGLAKMHAQDVQNCLCEFDKYERVRLGEGRPRSLYDGS